MSEKKTNRRDFLFTATYAVGAVGVAFNDDRIYCMQVQEGSNTVIIETDRPIQGSTSSGSQFLRCSMTYMA